MKILKNLSKSERTWVVLALIVIVVAGADRLVMTPLREQGKRLESLIEVKQKELAALRRTALRKPLIEQDYRQFSMYLIKPAPDEQETARLLGQIEAIARASQVTLLDTAAREPEDKGWYKKYKVEINAEATSQQLVKFLHRLNSTTEALRAEQVEVTTKGESSPFLKVVALVTKLTGSPQP